jgi:hypothetical protein
MSKFWYASLCAGLFFTASALPAFQAQPGAPATPPAPPAAGQPGAPPSDPAPANNPPVNNQPANNQPGAATQPSVGTQPGAAPQQPGAQPAGQQQQGQLFRAKQILGSKVQLSGNVSAGTVEDFVVAEDGYVEYVIVSNNGQMVTVPWDATQFNFEKQTAVINIEQEQFQKIPTYTADKYPTFSEPQYRTTIYRSYGLTPRERPALLPRLRGRN